MGKAAAAPRVGYSPELVARILDELATGESLKSIVRQDGMPNEKTVMRWLAKDAEFAAKYGAARAQGMEARAAEIIELADNAGLSNEEINKARLQIDARKWTLAKMLPRKYGEQLTLAGDEQRPLAINISSDDAKLV